MADRLPLAGILAVCLILPGCAGMPLSTMYKLHTMNPMEIDPAQLKVAIRADERIGIREDGVQVTLEFDAEDGSLHIDDNYTVVITRNPILTPELVDDKRPGDSVTVLQLSDGDARKMTRAQSQLKPYSEGSGRGKLSFGVDVSGVCLHSPIPPGEVLVDIFIQASDVDGFFAFTRDLDLRKSRDVTDAMLDDLPTCEVAENSREFSESDFQSGASR